MKKTMTASLTVILALILSLAVSPAHAAPPQKNITMATITVDPNDTGLDLAPSAADLSKNTGIQVVVGSCDGGPYCIELSKDECVAGSAGGCAWAVADEAGVSTCHVSIEPVAYNFDYWLTVFVTSHELVHCLTWIGGVGFFHVDDEKSIIWWQGYIQTMREQQTKIFSGDRSMLSEIFAGTWDGVW